MRNLIMTTLLTLFASTALALENYTIDPTHTYPSFRINHLGFSTMQGRFDKTQGSLTIDWAKKSGSIDIIIDASSISTGMKKRDDHLRSPDFLNAAEFPEITYKSTQVTINSDKTATVEGLLTIMETSRAVALNVNQINCGDHPMKKGTYVCGFDATAKIKRSDFAINYALPAIGDEIELIFEVEAHRN